MRSDGLDRDRCTKIGVEWDQSINRWWVTYGGQEYIISSTQGLRDRVGDVIYYYMFPMDGDVGNDISKHAILVTLVLLGIEV